jgi:acetyl esterase
MRRPYPGQPVLTAFFTTVYDTVGHTSIEHLDLDGIRVERRKVHRRVPPTTWITGRLVRSVGVGEGTATARDGYGVPLRLYRPGRLTGRRLPVILFFHGGGWVLGNPAEYDPLCTFLADRVGALVVSVDYRMAPEHRAPVAALDSIDAASWVADHGDALAADSSRMAVCGDSAGGNLAAVVAQAFRDEGRTAIRHQTLVYPATDLTMSSPSIDEHAHAPILTRDAIVAFRAHYLAGQDATDPLLSPLFGPLDGLPPALIQTADLDPIRDDGIRYARALEDAGCPVRLTNYVDAPHGFASFPGVVPVGRQHRAELVGEIARRLHDGTAGTHADGR